jgi:hypothetical protein
MGKLILLVVVVVAIVLGVRGMDHLRKEQQRRQDESHRKDSYIVGNLDRGRTGAAQSDISAYRTAFMSYVVDHGKPPESLPQLAEQSYINDAQCRDPWGQTYRLEYGGPDGSLVQIFSVGPDSVRGTADDIVIPAFSLR